MVLVAVVAFISGAWLAAPVRTKKASWRSRKTNLTLFMKALLKSEFGEGGTLQAGCSRLLVPFLGGTTLAPWLWRRGLFC